jgi:hypothetical protein
MAVRVGFEPPEELPPHTLSRSATVRPATVATVLTCEDGGPGRISSAFTMHAGDPFTEPPTYTAIAAPSN